MRSNLRSFDSISSSNVWKKADARHTASTPAKRATLEPSKNISRRIDSMAGKKAMPQILSKLESTYIQVKQTDNLLHEQLNQWFRHMEQWMTYQTQVFVKMQQQCKQLGIDEQVLSDADLLNDTDHFIFGGNLVLPRQSTTRKTSAKFSQAELHTSPAKLPVFVAGRGRTPRDKSGILEWSADAISPNGPERWGVKRSSSPGKDGLGLDRLRKWSPQTAPDMEQVEGDRMEGSTSGWSPIDHAPRTPKLTPTHKPGSPKTSDNGRNSIPLTPVTHKGSYPRISQASNESLDWAPANSTGSLPDKVSIQKYDSELVQEPQFGVASVDTAYFGNKPDKSAYDKFDNKLYDEMEWQDLPPQLQMWCELVDVILVSASRKRLCELREPWVQSDQFMTRVQRNHDNLDLRVLVAPKKSTPWRSSETPSRPSIMARAATGVHTGYQYVDEHFKSAKRLATDEFHSRCKIGVDPQSPWRLAWMSVGMFLMVYDLIVLPMQAFNFKEDIFMQVVQWFGQIFWTMDIFVTFVTGVYVNSELRTDFHTIARVYATSWLAFDVAVVLPLWIVEIIGGGGGGAENASVFKLFRMMRFLRLARLAKFEHYLQEALASVNSSSLILLVGIAKLMTGMIIISHLNACIWYAVGDAADGGWVDSYRDDGTMYNYLTSMHWAFTQFQGTSEVVPGIGGRRVPWERAYAVLVVMSSLIILSCFVSSLTNMMMQLQQLREEKMGMHRAVRGYLSDNDISKGLSVRVKKYIDWKQRMQRQIGHDLKILNMLPLALQMDLQEEVRGPLICGHKFLAAIQHHHGRIFRSICHEVLQQLAPAPGETIFVTYDECHQMFFCVAGTSSYMPANLMQLQNQRSGSERSMVKMRTAPTTPSNSSSELDNSITLGPHDYLSEPCLWTSWQYCGCLVGAFDSSFLTMPATAFTKVITAHPPSHVSVIFYARRFVAGLNRFGKHFHDIIDIDTLINTEELD